MVAFGLAVIAFGGMGLLLRRCLLPSKRPTVPHWLPWNLAVLSFGVADIAMGIGQAASASSMRQTWFMTVGFGAGGVASVLLLIAGRTRQWTRSVDQR